MKRDITAFLTARQVSFIRTVAEEYVVDRPTMTELLLPRDDDGSQTRRLANGLCFRGLIRKLRPDYGLPDETPTTAVYYPSEKGCRLLAEVTGDMRYLLTNTREPARANVRHFLAEGHVRRIFKASFAAQSLAELVCYANKFDLVCKDNTSLPPEDSYRLYTVVRHEPRKVICNPDGSMLVRIGEAQRGYYIEIERASTSPRKCSELKSPGYAGMDETGLFRRHFGAETPKFTVLVIGPTPTWRDDLRRAFSKTARPDLYRFSAMTDLRSETALYGKIWFPCDIRASADSLLVPPAADEEGRCDDDTGIARAG